MSERPLVPLQNRVTPLGEVAALPGRGSLMGNRGVIHDAARRIVRQWQGRRWISCRLTFRGRRRLVMQPRRYTELFFLDEATALAAGHRPCAECRSADYRLFRSLWGAHVGGSTDAESIDAVLHAERLDGRRKRTYRAAPASLPAGTFVIVDGLPHLVWEGGLFAWSDTGYAQRQPLRRTDVDVLTPASIVAVLAAGYPVAVHESACGGAPRLE